MANDKTIWAVGCGDGTALLARAIAVGASGVAVRTDNDVAKLLPLFHGAGLKVLGWRWPSAERGAAMREAARAAGLLRLGMDGYVVDPEGAPGKSYDWDRPGLERLAEDFCAAVREGGPDKPFGVTSHARASVVFPKLPWAAFFRHATVLLPQAYWRTERGVVGRGRPAESHAQALKAWAAAGGDAAKIVPMAGELAAVTAAEMGVFARAAAEAGKPLHVYAWSPAVKQPVWDAIARA